MVKIKRSFFKYDRKYNIQTTFILNCSWNLWRSYSVNSLKILL